MNIDPRRLLQRQRLACRCIHISQVTRASNARYTPVVFGVGAIFSFAYYFFYPDSSRSSPTLDTSPLSPSYFTPATVVSNETSGPNTRLLKLAVPPRLLPHRNASDPSTPTFPPIWSVYIKNDDIQVERPYTPLEGVDKEGRMLFWIKKYPKGEVGRWLHAKSEGDKIELRGPVTTWQLDEENWDEIVMISGGTGVTPFYQLFHSVISRKSEAGTRYTLLHSSHNSVELPPPRILDPLFTFATQNPDRFRMQLFVDSLEGSSLFKPQLGRIGKSAIEQCLGLNSQRPWWYKFYGKQETPTQNRRILFLICGPEPMINAISGPFGRNLSQGPVGGVLGQLGFTSHQVQKLSTN